MFGWNKKAKSKEENTMTTTSFKYDLGLHAKDSISGFEGIIMCRAHHLFGCSQYGIAPMEVGSDGQVKKTEYFDEARIVILGDGQHREGPNEFDKIFKFEGGKRAKDKVTDFEGKIVYRLEFLHTCNAYALIPSVDKDGKSRDCEQFDEGRIEILGEGIKPEEVKSPTHKTGPAFNRDAPRL